MLLKRYLQPFGIILVSKVINKADMRILLSSLFFFCSFTNLSAVQDSLLVKEETCRVEKVFPNPVNTHVYVTIYLEDYSITRFQLIDILGNKIQEWEPRQLVPGTQKVKLQLKSLRTGIYFLRIRIDGKDFVKRIRRK